MTDLDGARAAATAEPRAPAERRRRMPEWLLIFLTGLVLWVATVLVTFATQNTNLIPAIILVGSFLVPGTFVSFALTRADDMVTTQRIFVAFLCGGLLGVLGASVLEAAFLGGAGPFTFLVVGAIEEAVKLAALWLIARGLARQTVRDGLVLGAAVGFGFAAFESAGFAFNALFGSRTLSLLDVVETEGLRALLTPFGHGLWTAIVGGALFAVASADRPRRGLRLAELLGWFVVVALLHAFWDASSNIALWLTLLLTGGAAEFVTPGGVVSALTQQQAHLDTALSWTFLVLDALVGLVLLWARWRAAVPRRRRPVELRYPPLHEDVPGTPG